MDIIGEKMNKYKNAFNILDNLYNALYSEYQSLINGYKLDFKEKALNEINEAYESMINELNKQQNKTKRSNNE